MFKTNETNFASNRAAESSKRGKEILFKGATLDLAVIKKV